MATAGKNVESTYVEPAKIRLDRLKLHHLKIFLEIARQENITKAARSLNLTQPAISRTLGELETLVGTCLFRRRARGVVLSDAGELVLPHVHAIFSSLNRIGDEIKAFENGLNGMIVVGATMVTLPYLLPESLKNAVVARSGGLIRVMEGTIDQMSRALDRGEVDLVIGRVLVQATDDNLAREVLFEDPFVPVVGLNHPLAGKKFKGSSELSEFPWVLPPAGSSASFPVESYLFNNAIIPKRCVSETVSFQTILRLLESSETIAVLPRHLAVHGERFNAVSIVGPVIAEGSLSVGITCRKDRPLSPLGMAFCSAFRDAANDILA